MYFGIVALVVGAFSMSMLGNLSRNYKRAAKQKLLYEEQASHVVPTKMLV